MSSVKPVRLRIFCLCGQKMKVSSDMFGKPGKCIACRQKIRVPRPDELPPDTIDVHLKDHPEFLRSVAPPKKDKAEKRPTEKTEGAARQPRAPRPVIDAGDGQTRALKPIPLTVLKPMQLVMNYDGKILRMLQRHEAASREGKPAAGLPDNATLMGYRTLVQSALKTYRHSLQVQFDKISEELRVTRDQIVQTTLDFRTGDLEYSTYTRIVTPLRKRRERLFYQWQNIRGWLKLDSIPLAGGHVEVNLKEIPVEVEDLVLPAYPLADASLVEHGTQGLRDSLRERTHAEHRLNELDRMAANKKLDSRIFLRAKADEEAGRLRARTAVTFYRSRLEQLAKDFDDDTEAMLAHTEMIMRRTQRGEIERGHYKKRIADLQRAKRDTQNAKAAVMYALNANTADDVPYLKNSIIARLARPGVPRGIGRDSYVAWAGVALGLLSLILPISTAAEASNLVLAPGLLIAVFAAAGLVAFIAAIPRRDLRGTLLNLSALAASYGLVIYLFVAWHALTPLGYAWRSVTEWWMAPGLLAIFASLALLILAGFLALKRLGPLQYLSPVTIVLAIVGVLMLSTRFMGVAGAAPYLYEPEHRESAEQPGNYDVFLRLENRGWMPFWLGAEWPEVPASYALYVERRLGPESWEDFSMPRRPAAPRDTAQAFPHLKVDGQGPGVRLAYLLSPGTYRIRLEGPNSRQHFKSQSLTLVEFSADAGFLGAGEGTAAAAPPVEMDAVALDPPADTGLDVEVKLRGVLGNGATTRFAVELIYPDGRVAVRNVELGEVIEGVWTAHEFNSERNSLSLSDGEHLLVLYTGEQAPLRPPVAAQ